MFRKAALRQLNAPEQLDQAVRLVALPEWLLTVVLVAVVLGAAVWASIATVPQTVQGTGVLTHTNGVSQLDATASGQVMDVWVAPNQQLTAGTPLYSLQGLDGKVVTVNAPWDANVVALDVAVGQLVQPGTLVAELERIDTPGDVLEAVVFVPASAAPAVQLGMPAQLSVAAASSSTFGTLHGAVSAVGAFPETEESLHAFLGPNRNVQPFLTQGNVIRVVVRLDADPTSQSELKWSKSAPPFQLISQSQTTASFTVAWTHPIDWLLNK
jgi:multidrug efflux pump subunit AcrA (membrane-fusion protein)